VTPKEEILFWYHEQGYVVKWYSNKRNWINIIEEIDEQGKE